MVPILTELNISLHDGVVPIQLKIAYVHPLLKRSGLDANNMKNYHPISNLSFVSRLLERVVSSRLLAHMDRFSLHEPLQSAYKAYHSVETAMTRIQNDILCALDNQQVVILVLLDLSSAFDTIDHTILLQGLCRGLGISGTARKWLCSYLHGRKQTVVIGDSTPPPEELHTGVLQGLVLGSQLFLVYSAPLSRAICKHGLDRHFYADDTQLYFATKPTQDNVAELRKWIARCIAEIHQWMRANFLKLNDDSTEIMLFGSFHQLKKVTIDSISVGEVSINLSSTVRNLGILLDPSMSMVTHIRSICSSAHFHLRNIARIRPFLSKKATEQLVHAFITSNWTWKIASCLAYLNTRSIGFRRFKITQPALLPRPLAICTLHQFSNTYIGSPSGSVLSTNFFSMSTVHFPVKDQATCLTWYILVHPSQISAFRC